MTRRLLGRPSLLVIVLALVEAEMVSGPVRWLPLQVALALPLSLLLPGLLVQQALFVPPDAGRSDRLVLALGLSLAVLAVGGVVLNFFSVGIRPLTWLLYLCAVAVAADTAALVRNRPSLHMPSGRLPLTREFALGAVVLTITAAAFVVSIVAAERQRFPAFAQFWLVPGNGRPAYELGIHSQTGRRESYRVRLEVDGRHVRDWGPFTLSSGENWHVMVRLPVRASVRATLFRGGARGPYREVFIRHS
jgi:uncharacterized protein DUF1616